MLMESKTKPYSTAINDTESSDHWNFLEEIEAPMWADLSICDLTNDETDDSWFNISHVFHQCSSRQLISNVSCSANSISKQEPPSPKLPPSVTKSRGKNYRIKQLEQRKCKAIPNKQHPVKTLTKGSSMSTGTKNKIKPTSRSGKLKENQGLKGCSSGESNTSYHTVPKSTSPSIAKQEDESSSRSTVTSDHSKHQEKKSFEVSFQTSSQSSKLLSSLRNNLRRSCATRPAARVVVTNGERCSEGSSTNSSVGSHTSKKYNLGDEQKTLKTLKTPAALNVGSLSRQGNNMFASKITTKGKVQQQASSSSVRKVLMPLNINKQNQRIDKDNEKVGIGRRTATLAIVKETSETMASCTKGTSSVKTAQPIGHVQKASKERTTQKNGAKKLIGLKEKTDNKSKEKDIAKPARKVYFR